MDMQLRARGEVTIVLRDSATGAEQTLRVNNRVVNSGLIAIARNMIYRDYALMSQMACGYGTRPVDGADTGLASETARTKLTYGNYYGASLSFNATFGEGIGTGNVSELALFMGDGGLFARTVIPNQYKSDTTTMDVTWTITFIPV